MTLTALESNNSLFSSFSIHNFNNNNNNGGASDFSPTTPANSRACLACRMAHKSCDRGKPCSRCISRGISHLCCEPSTKKRGRPRKWKDGEGNQTTTTNNSTTSPTSPQFEQSNNIHVESSPSPYYATTTNSNMPSPTLTQHTSVSFESSSSSSTPAVVSSPTTTTLNNNTLYNAIPLVSSTCKSPTEEALLTETLKKTQSKKLKFIKIMNYNPNHRETFSPKFTITSSEKNLNLLAPKQSVTAAAVVEPTTTANSFEPSLKKRKTKSQQSPQLQVSHPTHALHFTSYQTSAVQPTTNNTVFSPPYSPTFNCYNQFYQPSTTNQPRHCDEGIYANNNNNNQIVKLPSIHSLLSTLP